MKLTNIIATTLIASTFIAAPVKARMVKTTVQNSSSRTVNKTTQINASNFCQVARKESQANYEMAERNITKAEMAKNFILQTNSKVQAAEATLILESHANIARQAIIRYRRYEVMIANNCI